MKIFWTEQERQDLIRLFPDNYTQEIAVKLKRTYRSVCSQANLLGLKKSENFKLIELSKQGERLKEVGKKSRFSEGHISHNKGVKMPDEVREKVKHTFFQRNHTPHNTKYDGYERITKDGYVEIRIKKGSFILKHRYIWEQAHGALPKKMKLAFKDGNRLNITLENLELISEAENAKRNNQLSHIELSDKYLAAIMSIRKPELRPLLLQQPQILELKRSQLKLLRVCRQSQNNTNQVQEK